MSETLKIDKLCAAYDGESVIEDLSLVLNKGNVACLLGPSGSGKTTLLRCIAGLTKPAKGRISLGEVLLSEPGYHLPPESRRIGMVFQEPALFPHLNLKENVFFGLKSSQILTEKFEELTDILALKKLEKRYPHQLSGGQKQRVSLGRALIRSPDLLLMDEPFSHLDSHIKQSLIAQMSKAVRETNTTTLVITHSKEDAFDLADQVGILLQKRILHWGSCESLYQSPSHIDVAGFMGMTRFITGEVNGKMVSCPLGDFEHQSDLPLQGVVKIHVNPGQIRVSKSESVEGNGVISKLLYRGTHYLADILLKNEESVTALFPVSDWISNNMMEPGTQVTVQLNLRQILVFPLSK